MKLFTRMTLLTVALPLFCQDATLALRDLPALVLANDTTISSSAQSALAAYHSYRSSVAQALPQLNFTNTYGLDYIPSIQTLQSFTADNGFSYSLDTTVNDKLSHNLNTALSLSQLLPTAGTLSLNLGNTMAVSSLGSISIPDLPSGITLPLSTPQFNQLPAVTVKIDQPLFLNGKILDLDLFPATLKKTELGYQKADLAKRAQTNQTLFQSAQLYLQIVQLRKNVDQTRNALAVAEGNLDTLQKNYDLGAVAEADLLDSKIALATQKGALLELRANLAKAERTLAHSIGKDGLEGLALDDDIPALDFTMGSGEAIEKALGNHPLVRQAALSSEERRVDDVLAGQRYASNLSLSFSFSPRYPYVNPSNPVDMTFETSFNRLFADGWSQDFGFSATLTLRLFDGGQARETRAGDAAMMRMAEDTLLSQKRSIRDQVETDVLQKENLEERISLLMDAVDLAKRRLDTESSLRDLGKSTDLDVDSRRADYQSKVNDLWKARADRFVTVLDLASLTGEDIAHLIEGNH